MSPAKWIPQCCFIFAGAILLTLFLRDRNWIYIVKPGQVWSESDAEPDPFRVHKRRKAEVVAVKRGYVLYRYQGMAPEGYNLTGEGWFTNSVTLREFRNMYENQEEK